MQAVRDISKEEADAAVDRVFDKCYHDWDPIGRIPRTFLRTEWRAISKEVLPNFTETETTLNTNLLETFRKHQNDDK